MQRLPATNYENDATWAPDGSIVFSAWLDANQNQEIFWAPSSGSPRTRLTDDPADDDEAEMSPDGAEIMFESDREGVYDLFVMAPDGSGVRRLLPDPATTERRRPSWRP